MGLKTEVRNEDKFRGTIHTLTCEFTGNRLAEILVKGQDESIVTFVEATSPFHKGSTSGKQKITGNITYGGVESVKNNTYIKDVEASENDDGSMNLLLKVDIS